MMATWQEMSRDCLRSAKALLAQGQWRGSINRSYYAAYCAVSHELVARGVRFPQGCSNPAHDQLPALIRNGLSLEASARRRLLRLIRILRRSREDADYRPYIIIDAIAARDGIRDATVILRDMGVI